MSARFTAPFTRTQQKVLAIVPKVTSLPSILGSLLIVHDILWRTTTSTATTTTRSQNRQRHRAAFHCPPRTTYHRLLLWMSVNDFVFACKSFVSTWPIPKDTRFVYGNVGTTTTCEIAGFLGHGSSLTSVLYNGSLALYFWVTIVANWTEHGMQKSGLERWLHAVPWTVGWATALAGLPLDLYNPIGWTCWIGSYPPGCGSEAPYGCTRGGNNIDEYRWALFHAILWAWFLLAGATLMWIYVSVKRREAALDTYRFVSHPSSSSLQPRQQPQRSHPREAALVAASTDNEGEDAGEESEDINAMDEMDDHGNNDNDVVEPDSRHTRRRQGPLQRQRRHELAKRVAIQAFLYQFFFLMTWIFPMVQFVVAHKTGYLYFPLLALTVIFTPLQGFLDCVIYLRPRYLKARQQPQPWWRALGHTLWPQPLSDGPPEAQSHQPDNHGNDESQVIIWDPHDDDNEGATDLNITTLLSLWEEQEEEEPGGS